MPIDVTMPKLSDTMDEGKIVRWAKAVGDPVAVGDILAEVETDKADMEMEAFDAGVLAEIRVPEGSSAAVGAVIAVLSEAGSAVKAKPAATKAPDPEPPAAAAPPPATKPAAKAPSSAKSLPVADTTAEAPDPTAGEDPAVASAPRVGDAPVAGAAPVASKPATAAPPRVAASASGERVKASPLARRIAGDRGVDLGQIAGTGPGGRIVQRDVEAAGAAGASASAAPSPTPTAPPSAPSMPPTARRVELSRIRRTTARRMADAKRDVPHFYVTFDAAMDECVRLRTQLLALGERFAGLTYTHFLLRALGLALRRVPEMNASWTDDAVVLHDGVHVGVATATDAGLMVPVARDCDTTALDALVPQVNALLQRTRDGKPTGNDLAGATFTLSNLGMFPVRDFAAIVNPPQAAILAVGTIREVPVVRDGAVQPGRVMSATLSCDHRAVDGALAGRFVRELVPLLENPLALVV